MFVTRVETPADGVNPPHRRGRVRSSRMEGRGGSGRPRPRRLERLPEQYFAALLGRVAAAAADGGPPVVDLGRGNPEVGPPPHVVEALTEAAARPDVHGYAPFRGLPRLREAIAHRYRTVYGVELDPDREVAVVPGNEDGDPRARARARRATARRSCSPTRTTPTIPPGSRSRGPSWRSLPLDPAAGWQPDLESAPPAAALYLNFPSNPCAVCAPAPASSRRRSTTRAAPAPRSCTTPPTSTSSSTGAGPRASWPRRARRRSASSSGRCRRPTAWRAGGSASCSGTPRSSSGSTCSATTPASGCFARAPARRDRRARGAAGARRGAARRLRAAPRPARRRAARAAGRARARSTSGCGFPTGLTPDRLLVEHRVALAPGEGFGPSGAGWARLSLAVTDETFDEGVARLAPALEAAYA